MRSERSEAHGELHEIAGLRVTHESVVPVVSPEEIGLVNFSKDVEMVRFSKQIKRKLKKIDKDRGKYLLVVI